MGIQELSCQELVEIITDYLEGALSDLDRERFERHLESCEGCRTYLDQMRRTIALAGTLKQESIPAPAMERLLQAFRRWRQE